MVMVVLTGAVMVGDCGEEWWRGCVMVGDDMMVMHTCQPSKNLRKVTFATTLWMTGH